MTTAFPLAWPPGWPRSTSKSLSPFSVKGFEINRRKVINELKLMGAGRIIISTNVPLRRDGIPYAENRRIEDPGVAVYFNHKDRPLVMARDRFWTPGENMRSIAMVIESLRAMERHGGRFMMERAFTGFAALPAPASKRTNRTWREILGLDAVTNPSAEVIGLCFTRLAKERHPDNGGSDEEIRELLLAREQALKEIAR